MDGAGCGLSPRSELLCGLPVLRRAAAGGAGRAAGGARGHQLGRHHHRQAALCQGDGRKKKTLHIRFNIYWIKLPKCDPPLSRGMVPARGPGEVRRDGQRKQRGGEPLEHQHLALEQHDQPPHQGGLCLVETGVWVEQCFVEPSNQIPTKTEVSAAWLLMGLWNMASRSH